MRKNINLICFISAGLLLMFADSCNKHKPTSTTTSGITKVYCDQSFENIMGQEVEVFEFTYPNASVVPFYTDESTVVDSLLKGGTDLAIIARDLTKDQKAYLKAKNGLVFSQRIAVDALALIVNKDNDIDEITMDELRDIFSGKVTRWGEVEPTKFKRDSIKIVFDNQGSSAVRFIRDSILGGKPFIKNVYAQKNSSEVFEAVKKSRNAIGIIGVSWITSDMQGKSESMEEKVKGLKEDDAASLDFSNEIKVLKLRKAGETKGYKPYQAYIYSGQYPLYRSIYAICSSPRGTLSHGFYTFITGFVGQKIIQNTGVLPATIQPRFVSLE